MHFEAQTQANIANTRRTYMQGQSGARAEALGRPQENMHNN